MLKSLKNWVRDCLIHSYLVWGRLNILINSFYNMTQVLGLLGWLLVNLGEQCAWNLLRNSAKILLKVKLSSVYILQQYRCISHASIRSAIFVSIYYFQGWDCPYCYYLDYCLSSTLKFASFLRHSSIIQKIYTRHSITRLISLKFPTSLSSIQKSLLDRADHCSNMLIYASPTKDSSFMHFLKMFKGFNTLTALKLASIFLVILSRISL